MNTVEIKKQLITARDEYISLIKSELLGPGSEFALPDAEHELISSSPTSRYSVGILYPRENKINQDNDETVPIIGDEVDVKTESTEDKQSEEVGSKKPTKDAPNYEFDETADESLDEEVGLSAQYMPSSMGITFLAKGNTDIVRGSLQFATYRNAKVQDCIIPFTPDESVGYSVPAELSHKMVFDKELGVIRLISSISPKEIREIIDRDTIPENELKAIKQIAYRFADYCRNGFVRVPHSVQFALDFTQGDYIDNNSMLDGTTVKVTALRKK